MRVLQGEQIFRQLFICPGEQTIFAVVPAEEVCTIQTQAKKVMSRLRRMGLQSIPAALPTRLDSSEGPCHAG